jgi:hypothetical protein
MKNLINKLTKMFAKKEYSVGELNMINVCKNATGQLSEYCNNEFHTIK